MKNKIKIKAFFYIYIPSDSCNNSVTLFTNIKPRLHIYTYKYTFNNSYLTGKFLNRYKEKL